MRYYYVTRLYTSDIRLRKSKITGSILGVKPEYYNFQNLIPSMTVVLRLVACVHGHKIPLITLTGHYLRDLQAPCLLDQ